MRASILARSALAVRPALGGTDVGTRRRGSILR